MERSEMGLFNRKPPEPPRDTRREPGQPAPAEQRRALAMEWQERAMQAQAQARQWQAQAMQQAAAFQQASAGATAARGSMTWVRQVLAILAPPQQGFVKRCSCVVCGAPKKLPAVTAYVYCDYCASLMDYDLRRACEGDTTPGPEYAATVNATQAASRAALADGDRAAYRDLQRKVYTAYAANVPTAVSHRARNDSAYLAAYVNYMAEFALARAFDPAAQALEADAADRLLGRAGLKNEYVPIQAHDGRPRHCGGCGGEFSALPGAKAVICDGCGRTMDLASAEIPCASCGATMTLPAGADGVACPFCQSRVERAGLR
jgi:LSD1 subclass zinc finger protein